MKKIMLLSALLIILTSATVITSLYSKKKITSMAKNLVQEKSEYWEISKVKIKPIELGDLLSTHLIEQKLPHDSKEKPQLNYKSLLAENPSILYYALKSMGREFITQFNTELLIKHEKMLSENASWKQFYFPELYSRGIPIKYLKGYEWNYSLKDYDTVPPNIKLSADVLEKLKRNSQDSLRITMELEKFSLKNYWREQRVIFNRYQNLMVQLLALPDKQLNSFISTISTPSDTIFTNWMFKKKLITKESIFKESGNYLGELLPLQYPHDLLALTKNTSRHYPEWTPRKFLNEALKFSNEVEKILPVYK